MMEERHTVIGIGPSSATKLPHADGHHISRLSTFLDLRLYVGRFLRLVYRALQGSSQRQGERR